MPPNWLWGYLLPVGLLLLTWGGLPPHKARRVTPLAALATALAILGYWAVGFAFHLGGAHAVNPDDPSLSGLDMLLAPLGPGWGILGLQGFFLSGEALTPTGLSLFLTYLPLIATAVLLVVLALAETRRWFMVLAGTLTGTLIVPIAACWIWGSGWLAHLGETRNLLGHGFVDFGGSALILWVPSMLILGILLQQPRDEIAETATPPPAYFPLLANVGVLFLGIGWLGWTLSSPFHTAQSNWDLNQAAINTLLSMSGAVITAQLYAWLVTGEPESLLAARGIAAGWGAILAGAPFLPSWAALGVGLLTGLAFSFILYFANVVLRLRDQAGTVALGVTGGLWGLLSVAIFSDGRWGQGWNNIGVPGANGDPGIGIAGIIAGGNLRQLQAQVVGLLALGLWGLLWGLLLGFIANPRLPRFKFALSQSPIVEQTDDDIEEKNDVSSQTQAELPETDDESGVEI